MTNITKTWKLNTANETDAEVFKDAAGNYFLRSLVPISATEAVALIEQSNKLQHAAEVAEYHAEEAKVGLL